MNGLELTPAKAWSEKTSIAARIPLVANGRVSCLDEHTREVMIDVSKNCINLADFPSLESVWGVFKSRADVGSNDSGDEGVNMADCTTTFSMGSQSYARLLKADLTHKREVSERLGNTVYWYFLGKLVAFLVVENYVKNVWSKYGFQKAMMNFKGFFKFSSERGIEEMRLVIAVPRLDGKGVTLCTIQVEYECKPPRCPTCKTFRHCIEQFPKKIIVNVLKSVKAPRQASRGFQSWYLNPFKKNSTTNAHTRAKGCMNTKVSNTFDVLSTMADMNDECDSNTSNPTCEKVVNEKEDNGLDMKNMEDQGLNVERLVTESQPSTLSGLLGGSCWNEHGNKHGMCNSRIGAKGKNMRYDHAEIHEYERYEQYDFIVSPTTTTRGDEAAIKEG
ncbi:hypothetical protein Tco_1030076 [Tanacetum coccineum]|uniref:Zinc knuckle CX2CX4HX4C n=1 Tax=Tanacetum coccineum TaxID=301880 RepID=A0ABQ5G571_9ASTR